jgi:HEAT repeat protein
MAPAALYSFALVTMALVALPARAMETESSGPQDRRANRASYVKGVLAALNDVDIAVAATAARLHLEALHAADLEGQGLELRLVELLKDGNSEVRRAAAAALGRTRGEAKDEVAPVPQSLTGFRVQAAARYFFS